MKDLHGLHINLLNKTFFFQLGSFFIIVLYAEIILSFSE